MKIEIGKFILQSQEDRFDIIEIKQVEKLNSETREKTGEVYAKEETVAYDMRLESALRYVVSRTLNDQSISLSLPQYVDAFKKELQKITNLLA